MILLLASVGLSLFTQDPEGEVIRTAKAPQVEAEAVVGTASEAAPVTLQDAEPHGLTTDQQIQRWLAAGSGVETVSGELPAGPIEGVGWDSERRVRGEFSVGVGTEGYRSYGASVSVPLGERGHLELHYREVENGYPAYGRYGSPYGYDYDPDWPDVVITPWRSDAGLEPVDARMDGRLDRSRAWQDYGRTRPASGSSARQ